MLQEAGVGSGESRHKAGSAAAQARSEDPLDATSVGFSVPPRKRLMRADIVEMLEQVEDHLTGGGELEAICVELGISKQRYLRWCQEHGETRADREKSMADLQRENSRLRKLVADLSLERESLREAAAAASEADVVPDTPAANEPGEPPEVLSTPRADREPRH